MKSAPFALRSSCLAVLLLTGGVFAQGEDEAAARDFVAWASEVAIPIDLDAGVAPAILEPLVVERRVVFLGEPDHFIHQKYPFRLEFLRALHALGWRHLGMEMGRSDGIAFDRYLDTGDEDWLLRVGLYSGARDVGRAVESGGFQGMEFRYARGVRGLAQGAERVRYFGYDLDMRPGRGFEDALGRLEGESEEALAPVLEDLRRDGEPLEGLRALHDELADEASGLAELLSAAAGRQLLLDLDTLIESLHFQKQSVFTATEAADVIGPFQRREQAMFRLFDAYLAELPPDAKIALTGHNMHLTRDWRDVRWREIGNTEPVEMWPSIGAHVSQRLPGEVYGIWLVYDHGEHMNASNLSQIRELDSVEGSVESLLAELPHDALLLPLASDDPRSRWLDGERSFRVNGGVAHGYLRRLTDALFFVREVAPPGVE